jgi:hypothetical protein
LRSLVQISGSILLLTGTNLWKGSGNLTTTKSRNCSLLYLTQAIFYSF